MLAGGEPLGGGAVSTLQIPCSMKLNTNDFSGKPTVQTQAVQALPITMDANPKVQTPPGPATEWLSARTIKRAQSGDSAALNEMLSAVRPRVVAVAFRLVKDADDAEDVVQDALTKVWRNLCRYEGRSAFSTWLHRIVVNTALDHLRARRSGVVSSVRIRTGAEEDGEPVGPMSIDTTTPEELLGRAEVGQVVRGAMSTLSPSHREVLALRELDGESYQDIASLARCPVGTVMSRLHHARQRLAEALTMAPDERVALAA